MYLHKRIFDPDGTEFRLAGIIDGECRYTGHLIRFGYMYIKSCGAHEGAAITHEEPAAAHEGPAAAHEEPAAALPGIRGHEFHYYDSTNNGVAVTALKPVTGRSWECIHEGEAYFWGFPHLYYPSNEEFTEHFVKVMKERKQ